VSQHTRLHELIQLVPPAPVPGRLVAAAEDDVDLVEEWCAAFRDDADEQAGRPRGVQVSEDDDRAETPRQLTAMRQTDESGRL
jgi:hypothetical protein